MNVTYIIILANVLVYLGIAVSQIDANKLIYDNTGIKVYKQWYRMLSSGFTHISITHILFNMLALYSFGMFLETFFIDAFLHKWPTKMGFFAGRFSYFLLYVLSILGGSLYIYVTKKEDYFALGASGGVFGVVYACILLQPNIGISLFFIPVAIPGWILGIVISIGSILLSVLPRNFISHEGHLGGGLFGGLCMFLCMYLYKIPLQNKSLYFLLFGIGIAGVFLLFCIFTPKEIEKIRLFMFRKLEERRD